MYDEFRELVSCVEKREKERDDKELLLIESEEQYKQISDLSFDAIIVVGKDRISHYWNEASLKMFAYSKSQLIEEDVLNLIFSEKDHDYLNNKINSSETIDNEIIEMSAIRKDGEIFPIEISIAKTRISERDFFVFTIRDISKWKKSQLELINAREKAEESDRLKSSFLANMSHEIRTPMNAIIGFSELLLRPQLFEKQKDKFLNYIVDSGNNLLNLIDDIIDISKIEAGRLKIKKQECDIERTMNELYASFVTINERRETSFELNLNMPYLSQKPFILTDIFRFKQIFNNLLGNALKFTEKGYVEFGFKFDVKNEILFYVTDTGIGMPQDKLDIIFEQFGQIEDTENKNQRGTGLGLAISEKLTILLGGKMWVDSLLGKGSTFYFTLPYDLSIVPIEPDVNKGSNPDDYDWSGRTILIAEDEEMNYLFIQEILTYTGAKTIRVSNGKEAVAIFKKEKIDLVLMDIKMPEMDGFEATQQIKSINKRVPIIAQTAYAMADERQQGLEAGCDDFISKPIDIDKLLVTINRFIR